MAKIENGEKILEIGPGLGSLTAELSLNADVTAIELDQYLIPPLKEVIAQYGNAKNSARSSIKIKKSYAPAYYELAIAELNLCNIPAAKQAFNKAKRNKALK